jgi:hypothetical protein
VNRVEYKGVMQVRKEGNFFSKSCYDGPFINLYEWRILKVKGKFFIGAQNSYDSY